MLALFLLAAQAATQWSVWEASFSASRKPGDWAEPALSVEFEHEAGARMEVEAFWDGGTAWKVRFAPPRAGQWRWRAVSADPALTGRAGALAVRPADAAETAANPNLRGHVRVTPGRRYLEYPDGSPFLMLADTLWSMNTVRCGLEGGFREWLLDRKAKRFTAVLTEFFEVGEPNEHGYPFPANTDGTGSFDKFNPAHFRGLDARMAALWKAGLVVAAHPTWVGKQHGVPPEVMRRATRYLVARYGAYNVVWSLSGEYQYSYTNRRFAWKKEDWNALGEAVRGWDPYGHPLTIHPSGQQWRERAPWPRECYLNSSSGEFHETAWLDHNWLQTGHATEALGRIAPRLRDDYRRTPVKPAVLSEAFYENHKLDGATSAQVRWQAWAAFLNGAAGYGYGGAGVWQFYDPAHKAGKDRRNSRPIHGTAWREALAYEGAAQMRHVRAYLESIPWWTLAPRSDLLLVDGAPADPQSLQDPHCAASLPGLVVIYLPPGNHGRRIEVRGLPDGPGRAQWFNPRDGSRRSAAFSFGPLPRPPDNGDWVLELRPGPRP